MERAEILSKLSELLGEVIDDDDLVLEESTTADEVEDWDSLAHVKYIIAIESEFGIRFDVKEIGQAANVGEMVDLIVGKL